MTQVKISVDYNEKEKWYDGNIWTRKWRWESSLKPEDQFSDAVYEI